LPLSVYKSPVLAILCVPLPIIRNYCVLGLQFMVVVVIIIIAVIVIIVIIVIIIIIFIIVVIVFLLLGLLMEIIATAKAAQYPRRG
jgi:hypothetical protein